MKLPNESCPPPARKPSSRSRSGHRRRSCDTSPVSISSNDGRVGAGAYLLIQGILTFAWWIAMSQSITIRRWFVPSDAGWVVARELLVPDLVVFGAGSFAVGALVLARHRAAAVASWVLCGATVYATAIAWTWLGAPVEHWVGAAAMSAALVVTGAIAVNLTRSPGAT